MAWSPELVTPDMPPRRGWFAGQHAPVTTVPVAAATAAALVPVMHAGSTMVAPLATATADTITPGLIGGATITAPMATAGADGIVPVVVGGSTINAPVATATADTISPSLVEGSTITAPLATAGADGIVPTIIESNPVIAPLADASADAPVPVVGHGAGILPPVAAATADGLVPVLSSGQTLVAPLADSTADALVPSAGGGSAVTATLATATADALAPAVGGGSGVVVPVAAAAADGLVPAVGAGATVVATVAAATADTLVPSAGVTYDGPVTAILATATADALVPIVSAGSTAVVPLAIATADGLVPAVGGGSGVTAPVAAATADTLVPIVAAVNTTVASSTDNFERVDPGDGFLGAAADGSWVDYLSLGGQWTIVSGVAYTEGAVAIAPDELYGPGTGTTFEYGWEYTEPHSVEVTMHGAWATGDYLVLGLRQGLDEFANPAGVQFVLNNTTASITTDDLTTWEDPSPPTGFAWADGDVIKFETVYDDVSGETDYKVYRNGVLLHTATDPDSNYVHWEVDPAGTYVVPPAYPGIGGLFSVGGNTGLASFTFTAVPGPAPPPLDPSTLVADNILLATVGDGQHTGPRMEPWLNYSQVLNGTTAPGTVTCEVGDLLVAFAFNNGSTTVPTKPVVTNVWNDFAGTTTAAANTCAARMAYKIAASTSEATGTWTNATRTMVVVYKRGTVPRMASFTTGTGATLTYPSGGTATDATKSWWGRFAGHRTSVNMQTNTPAGYVQRSGSATAGVPRALDSNGIPGASPSSVTQAVTASSGWITATIELIQAAQTLFTPVGYDFAPRGTMRGSGTLSQSDVYSGTTAATYANMTNGNAAGNSSNAAGTNAASGAYIKYDIGSTVAITDVVLGVDYNSSMPGGWGPQYFVNRFLQGSTDDTNWTTIKVLPNYALAQAEGVGDGLVTIAVNASYRYLRVVPSGTNYVQLTEFQVWS